VCSLINPDRRNCSIDRRMEGIIIPEARNSLHPSSCTVPIPEGRKKRIGTANWTELPLPIFWNYIQKDS
jgi:hypothetical protein